MYCPFCQAEDTKVIDSRLVADGSQIRRRRECEVCHSRFTTFEIVFGKILKEIRVRGVREIKSIEIGEIMMNALKEVDTVAYVRFASVYRDFQDIKDFSEEISSLAKEKPKRKKSKK